MTQVIENINSLARFYPAGYVNVSKKNLVKNEVFTEEIKSSPEMPGNEINYQINHNVSYDSVKHNFIFCNDIKISLFEMIDFMAENADWVRKVDFSKYDFSNVNFDNPQSDRFLSMLYFKKKWSANYCGTFYKLIRYLIVICGLSRKEAYKEARNLYLNDDIYDLIKEIVDAEVRIETGIFEEFRPDGAVNLFEYADETSDEETE